MIEVLRPTYQVYLRQTIENALARALGYTNVSFDLEDCDRILRIEAATICNSRIVHLLKTLECEVLPG